MLSDNALLELFQISENQRKKKEIAKYYIIQDDSSWQYSNSQINELKKNPRGV